MFFYNTAYHLHSLEFDPLDSSFCFLIYNIKILWSAAEPSQEKPGWYVDLQNHCYSSNRLSFLKTYLGPNLYIISPAFHYSSFWRKLSALKHLFYVWPMYRFKRTFLLNTICKIILDVNSSAAVKLISQMCEHEYPLYRLTY